MCLSLLFVGFYLIPPFDKCHTYHFYICFLQSHPSRILLCPTLY